ncbi:hypothetical protein [Treponema sp.]|uniref:hypothetical protein n=1 Tax=Treponema sp. TaxID=166 RepID=UPI00298DA56A|nr:hypothetical protein [Treponema sp.]MCR5612891.1 hypothetical protein [Treponema sp.]
MKEKGKSFFIFILLAISFVINAGCKEQVRSEYEFRESEIYEDFKMDFEKAQTKYQNSIIYYSGIIVDIEYPIESYKDDKCTIHFGLTIDDICKSTYTQNFLQIAMKDHIDESYIGKQVLVKCEYKTAYQEDDGIIVILLKKGELIE